MTGLTIELPEDTLRKLREEARRTGRSVAAIVRERVESQDSQNPGTSSVFALTADLAGCLEGGKRAATNARRKFRRS